MPYPLLLFVVVLYVFVNVIFGVLIVVAGHIVHPFGN